MLNHPTKNFEIYATRVKIDRYERTVARTMSLTTLLDSLVRFDPCHGAHQGNPAKGGSLEEDTIKADALMWSDLTNDD